MIPSDPAPLAEADRAPRPPLPGDSFAQLLGRLLARRWILLQADAERSQPIHASASEDADRLRTHLK